MPTLYIQIPAKASFYSLSCWDNFEHRHDSWFYKIVRIISSWRIKDAEQKNFISFPCKLNVSSIHYKINHLTQKGSDLTEKCCLKEIQYAKITWNLVKYSSLFKLFQVEFGEERGWVNGSVEGVHYLVNNWPDYVWPAYKSSLPVGVRGFCKNNEITKIYVSPLSSITSPDPGPGQWLPQNWFKQPSSAHGWLL